MRRVTRRSFMRLGLPLLALAAGCEARAGERIAFFHGNDVYVVQVDGSGLTRLTHGKAGQPSWSPDGKRLLFHAGVAGPGSGNGGIFAVNANGSGLTRLVAGFALAVHPQWSPDGRQIAFVGQRTIDGNPDIYVMHADGSNQRNVTNDPAAELYGVFPAPTANPWSPDGTHLGFSRGVPDAAGAIKSTDIYVIAVDGSGARRLTHNPEGVLAYFAGWTPSGSAVLALNGVHLQGTGVGLALVGLDGSGDQSLHDLPVLDVPSWSPDGRRMAFFGVSGEGVTGLYVAEADGSGLHAVSSGNCDGLMGHAWSPDSLQIAYVRGCTNPREESELWAIYADGAGNRRVTDQPALFPAWSPAG